MKRGQVSIEYLMIIGLLLLVTIPLFVYAFIEVKRNIQMNHADDAVHTIANAADTVYSLGPGSKKYVWITMPGGVTQTLVNETEVSMKLYIFGGESDVFAKTKPTVIGSIPSSEGPHRIAVEALSFGVVRIGEATTDNDPPNITRVYPNLLEGQNVCPGLVTIGADTDEPATCKYDTQKKDNYNDWAFDFEGRSMSHYKTIYLTEGSYTYYARCVDYSENFMANEDSASITFTVATPCIGGGIYGPEGPCYGQPEDTDSPAITITVPQNWANLTFPLVDFNYTATDATSGIEYCVANISKSTGPPDYGLGELYAQAYDDTVSETALNSVRFAFDDKGVFIWNIFCIDDSCAHNQGVSGYRTLNVSKTFFEAFLTSCAGWCGWQGFTTGGICMLNPNKCENTCEPPLPGYYEEPSKPKCYAGLEISEEYCPLESGPPSCCCLP